MKIIELIDYNKKYRRNNVLNNINISFEKGKSYLLIGSNGSGKSTIIKSILGLVKYKGLIIKRSNKFGYVPEKTIIPLNLTVYEFLYEVSLLKGVEGNIDKLIDQELLRWNIESKKHKLIKTLSKGMMQKVAIIQSLLIDNDVYFFDEVLNGLDQENQKLFFDCIKELENKRKTIIISTHYPKEYIDFIDNLYLVKEGQINEYSKDQFKVN